MRAHANCITREKAVALTSEIIIAYEKQLLIHHLALGIKSSYTEQKAAIYKILASLYYLI